MRFTSEPGLTSEPPLVEPYAIKAVQRVSSLDCRGQYRRELLPATST
jgi:hypothetical protein